MYNVYEDSELQQYFNNDFKNYYNNKKFSSIKDYGSYLVEFLIRHFDNAGFSISDKDLKTKTSLTIEVSELNCPLLQVEEVVNFITMMKPYSKDFVATSLDCMDTKYNSVLFILGKFDMHKLVPEYKIKLIDTDTRIEEEINQSKRLISFNSSANMFKTSIKETGVKAWGNLIGLINKTSPNLIKDCVFNNRKGYKVLLKNPTKANIRIVYNRLSEYANYLRIDKCESVNLVTQKINDTGIIVHIVKPTSDLKINTVCAILIG